jgi:hypothetical protein
MSQSISLAAFENRAAQVGEPIEHAADVEEKENEQLPCMRSAGNGSVEGLQTAGQAVVHPKTAATVVAWHSFPFIFPAVIAGLSQPRRLLGAVFDDTRGHIHVGLDSGSAVFETKCVRQFPSIIPGLLFCR